MASARGDVVVAAADADVAASFAGVFVVGLSLRVIRTVKGCSCAAVFCEPPREGVRGEGAAAAAAATPEEGAALRTPALSTGMHDAHGAARCTRVEVAAGGMGLAGTVAQRPCGGCRGCHCNSVRVDTLREDDDCDGERQ